MAIYESYRDFVSGLSISDAEKNVLSQSIDIAIYNMPSLFTYISLLNGDLSTRGWLKKVFKRIFKEIVNLVVGVVCMVAGAIAGFYIAGPVGAAVGAIGGLVGSIQATNALWDSLELSDEYWKIDHEDDDPAAVWDEERYILSLY